MKLLHPVTVKGRLRALWFEAQKAEKQFKARLEKIESRRKQIQDRCPHKNQHFPSPCGGSDSYYGCSICHLQSDTREGLERKP